MASTAIFTKGVRILLDKVNSQGIDSCRIGNRIGDFFFSGRSKNCLKLFCKIFFFRLIKRA